MRCWCPTCGWGRRRPPPPETRPDPVSDHTPGAPTAPPPGHRRDLDDTALASGPPPQRPLQGIRHRLHAPASAGPPRTSTPGRRSARRLLAKRPRRTDRRPGRPSRLTGTATCAHSRHAHPRFIHARGARRRQVTVAHRASAGGLPTPSRLPRLTSLNRRHSRHPRRSDRWYAQPHRSGGMERSCAASPPSASEIATAYERLDDLRATCHRRSPTSRHDALSPASQPRRRRLPPHRRRPVHPRHPTPAPPPSGATTPATSLWAGRREPPRRPARRRQNHTLGGQLAPAGSSAPPTTSPAAPTIRPPDGRVLLPLPATGPGGSPAPANRRTGPYRRSTLLAQTHAVLAGPRQPTPATASWRFRQPHGPPVGATGHRYRLPRRHRRQPQRRLEPAAAPTVSLAARRGPSPTAVDLVYHHLRTSATEIKPASLGALH